jgi:hypothetical protein
MVKHHRKDFNGIIKFKGILGPGFNFSYVYIYTYLYVKCGHFPNRDPTIFFFFFFFKKKKWNNMKSWFTGGVCNP